MAIRKHTRRRVRTQLVRYPDLERGYELDVALRKRWLIFQQQLRRCRRRCSEPAVHDLRVATRRIVAALDLLQTIAPSATVEKTRRHFKRLLKTMGPLRDMQVKILMVRNLRSRFPALELFRTVLLLRERRMLKQISDSVVRVNQTLLRASVMQCLSEMRRLFRNAHVRQASESALEGALGAAFTRVASMRIHVDRRLPASVHNMRVAFKKYRYASEILRPGIGGELHKAMNAFQTKMGDLHDLEVLLENVRTYAAQQPQPVLLIPVRKELERQLAEERDTFMKSANDFQGFFRAEFPGHERGGG